MHPAERNSIGWSDSAYWAASFYGQDNGAVTGGSGDGAVVVAKPGGTALRL